MDRDRLKEVHQTDLTESKVNEDFVDWLKGSGPTYLLVALIGLCAYLGIVRWRQSRANYRAEAWQALFQADLPGSFEDVVREYGDVDQLGLYARVQAADRLLSSVQSGLTLEAQPPVPSQPGGPVPSTEDSALTDEERSKFLDRADVLYDEIIAADDGGSALTLYAVGAMNGKAAVAESRGDVEGARTWFDRAAERAGEQYPGLAAQARARSASVAESVEAAVLKRDAEVRAASGTTLVPQPISIDASLRDLLLPPDDEGAGG